MSGLLVAVEGPDFAGKTTFVRELDALLRTTVRPSRVVITREPGGTTAGREIRDILMDNHHSLTPRAGLLLFAADRAEHVAKVIRPALEADMVVVTDRYIMSTRVYQRLLGLTEKEITTTIALAGAPEPDLTIVLAPPLEQLKHRASLVVHDAMESRTADKLSDLRWAFILLAAEYPSMVFKAKQTHQGMTFDVVRAAARIVEMLKEKE